MTALAADLNVQSKGSGDLREYLVADNVTIYKGAIVVLDSSGYARPARNTAGEMVIGVADVKFDNTGTGHAAGARATIGGIAGIGDKGVRVLSGRHFAFLCSATATQGSVGLPFYALDDQTVRATAGNSNAVGIVSEYVDATHVWVFIPTLDLSRVSTEADVFGQIIVSGTGSSALAVGPNGTTNPALQVDNSTASAATGIKITAAAAAGGVAIAAISSGADENVTLDAKGSGTVTINGTGTGNISLARATGVTGALTVTSASASALAVGRLGATTPAFAVHASTGTQVTGLIITGKAAGSGASIATQGGNAAETLDIDSKGTGNIVMQGTATGNVVQTNGDHRLTAGNYRAGAVSAFATTEPTSAIVFKQGTAFAGAIATSGGLMSNGTVLRKIIADGTVSNVES